MYAMFNGQPIFGPRGPAGPDGNPIGTIISYMGLTAPKDYLICDGMEYNVADYPDLASFFTKQFGTANYFGGDGTTTFAVPDMRNLFLRGYHGEAAEQLSANIGEKQDATESPSFKFGGASAGPAITIMSPASGIIGAKNIDSVTARTSQFGVVGSSSGYIIPESGDDKFYTSRPVNMAVLYCIKAKESVPAENVYSTEETRIGTWIDGKPLYRKTYNIGSVTTPIKTYSNLAPAPPDIDTLIFIDGVYNESGDLLAVNNTNGRVNIGQNGYLKFYALTYTITWTRCNIIIEYTKTTD